MGRRPSFNKRLNRTVLVERCFKCRRRSLESTISYSFYAKLNPWLLAGDALSIDLKDET